MNGRPDGRWKARWLLPALLVPVVLVVHGYHPWAGDAGIYVAGVRHALNPSLYPRNAVFVTAFTRYSAFAWVLAGATRALHMRLAWVLLAAYLASAYLWLAACGELAAKVFGGERSRPEYVRLGAVLLAAGCFTLPVAGTALFLMDPYVTARSFSTPLTLLAVGACLDRRWLRTGLLLALAAALHPLMAAYAAALVVLLGLMAAGRVRIAVLACGLGLAACGAAFAAAQGQPVSAAYRECVLLPPRTFLFLARWQWYEVLGLLLPLALLALAAWRLGPRSRAGALCLAALLPGGTSMLIAALFVPVRGPYALVPLQVLRSFHAIYGVGVVLVGGWVGSLVGDSVGGHMAGRLSGRWVAAGACLLLFAGMFEAERASWPECRRIEWPGAPPLNPYRQAFLWIRENTPRDAVFAFDPRLVYRPGEDEQGFRAIVERDQLADDKDAGVAAVLPSLAEDWARQRNAELGVDGMTDAERRAALVPLGAGWVLLGPRARTALPCPFRNAAVQVCRLN